MPKSTKECREGCEVYVDWKELEAENARLVSENHWIPVDERLPKNIADVWIILSNPLDDDIQVAAIGFYGENENGFGWEIYGDGLLTYVTHWKPIILS